MKKLVVAVHDVCPPFLSELKEISDALNRAGIQKRCLKVIPSFQGKYPILDAPSFMAWLEKERKSGQEIIHHGYEHQRRTEQKAESRTPKKQGRLSRPAEFFRMSYEGARRAIIAGKKIFQAAGIECIGFTAPAWRQSRSATRAVRDSGFAYYTSLLWFHDCRRSRKIFSPAFGFMGVAPFLESLAMIGNALMKNTVVPFQPLTRIVLHPQHMHNHRAFSYVMSMLKELASKAELIHYREILRSG